ncbi:MAG: GNAT family N-acetyltransferase, partial [Bacteroidota bacterium]|nr:GNAT family N-acetyltransferase [Bacteroidota bacterium]
MKIFKYGITLKRITEDDLELLRTWRNSEHVNRFMEYREHITVGMQKKWFESVNNYNNFYYLIIYKGEKVGVINDKDILRGDDKVSEAGLFIAEEKYRNTHVPLLASLMMIEISLFILQGKINYIHVLRDNKQAIAYNKSLGYQLCERQDDVENQKYFLTPEN